MNYLPMQSQWTRCGQCGYCRYIEWKPDVLHAGGIYIDNTCAVCMYRWSRESTIESLVNALRADFKEIKKGKDPYVLQPMIELFSNAIEPEILRECYDVAKAIFTDTFIKMWARSLQ